MTPDQLDSPEARESAEMKRVNACLAVHQPFVWSADSITNLSRSGIIGICHMNKAAIRVVWIEAPWEDTLKNTPDGAALEEKGLQMELPQVAEADTIEWISTVPNNVTE